MSDLSPAELLYPDLDQELASVRRYLERFPEGKNDWRPHEKSMAFGPLATHIAQLPSLAATMMGTDELDVASRKPTEPAKSSAELLKIFDENAAALKKAAAGATMADLEKAWTLKFGDYVIVSAPKCVLMRQLLISHIIHHRAQLGVYYRQLGVPVPSTYGPSADEQPGS